MVLTDKAFLRRQLRDKLKSIPLIDRIERSKEICSQLIQSKIINIGDKVLCYMALPYEVVVDELINYVVSIGAIVYLPRVNGQDIEVIKQGQGFTNGAYGISEPVGEAEVCDMNIVILPLLGVSINGDRLGKGKGYYDRYLSKSSAIKVAVAFKEQLLQQVPTESHDIKVDKVFVG